MLRHLPQGLPSRMPQDERHPLGRMELLQMPGEAVQRTPDQKQGEEDGQIHVKNDI